MTTRVAAVQMSSGPDPQANLAAAVDLVHAAADAGATYVQLPEYFNYLGPREHFCAVSETIPGPTTTRLGAVAASRAIALHLGSMLETFDGRYCCNTSVVLDASGDIVATYRKAHLFDINVPGVVVQRESDSLRAGDELVVASVQGLRLGLSICFDLRFPELYRQLALSGADVFAVPSAFTAQTGPFHWEVLVRARAIENHAFVIAAAQQGTTVDGISTFGHSLIVDPWGVVLAESSSAGEEVLVATVDVDEVARRRRHLAVLNQRRPELYDAPAHAAGPPSVTTAP